MSASTGGAVYKVDYSEGGGSEALLRYMDRGSPDLKDRAGRPMDDKDIERFVDKTESRHNGFRRHVILSPDPDSDLSREELDRAARRYGREFTEDKPSATYAYALWDEDEERERGPHVHMAVAGDREDLYMDRDDLTRERERLNEKFREQERQRDRTQQREREHERQRQRELEREKENEREREREEQRQRDNSRGRGR